MCLRVRSSCNYADDDDEEEEEDEEEEDDREEEDDTCSALVMVVIGRDTGKFHAWLASDVSKEHDGLKSGESMISWFEPTGSGTYLLTSDFVRIEELYVLERRPEVALAYSVDTKAYELSAQDAPTSEEMVKYQERAEAFASRESQPQPANPNNFNVANDELSAVDGQQKKKSQKRKRAESAVAVPATAATDHGLPGKWADIEVWRQDEKEQWHFMCNRRKCIAGSFMLYETSVGSLAVGKIISVDGANNVFRASMFGPATPIESTQKVCVEAKWYVRSPVEHVTVSYDEVMIYFPALTKKSCLPAEAKDRVNNVGLFARLT